MTICYFTATGNSLYVARRIGGRMLSIPKQMRQDSIEIEDDAVGIVSPVYVGGMPKMVREFLRRADIKTDYLFYIATCGTGGSFSQLSEIAREQGLDFKYCNIIVMADNFLPMFEIQDQIETLPAKNVEAHLSAILEDINAREERPLDRSGGRSPAGMFMKMLEKKVLRSDAAQDYIVNENCVHCGICAKVCPAENITVTGDKVIFSDRCEVCYACVHNCPQNAIHLKKETSSARFRNEQVSLQDIIEAND